MSAASIERVGSKTSLDELEDVFPIRPGSKAPWIGECWVLRAIGPSLDEATLSIAPEHASD